jgi:uncharacterized membrane protein
MFSALRWLQNGFADMRATGFVGAFYGLVFVLAAYTISFIYATFWKATMGLTAGFFLMGPLICTGIYELSRQVHRGEQVSLTQSMMAWLRNWKSIGFFAIILTFLMIVWVRVSIVLFALFASHEYPDLQSLISQIVSVQNLEFLMVWLSVGSIFATLAFALSVVSVPMMLDRSTDTLTAIFTSANALWDNIGVCFVWSALIVLLVGAALLFFIPLLLLIAPLIGHATWHAYQALVSTSTHSAAPALEQ